ncbi:EAL domain-containing protein [Sinorhizobium meliloti]|nr:EAL domain-containing protein [Sinorhizobium meliloti]
MKPSDSQPTLREETDRGRVHAKVVIRRLVGFVCFLLFLSAFKLGPDALSLGEAGRVAWLFVFQVVGLMVTSALSLYASRRGMEDARSAWKFFAVGHLLYLSGNLYGTYIILSGQVETFPSVRETAYFLMAIAFALGMSQYGEVSRKVTKTNVYNFVLVYCAITVACFFVLREDIDNSVLTKFGAVVAFLYPALWLSVAAFGAMSLAVYSHGRRLFPLQLLLGAVSAEAFADMVYAKELIGGTYVQGGTTEFLWVCSIGFAIWAVVEHLSIEGVPERAHPRQRAYASMALASLPGVAIIIFMFSGSAAGAFGSHPFYVGFSVLLGLVFAAVAGLREHSIIHTLQTLTDEAAEGRRRVSAVLESTSDSVVVLDREWRLTYFNGSARKILATARGALNLGDPLWTDLPPDEGFPGMQLVQAAFRDQKETDYEAAFGEVWLGVHVFPRPDGVSIFFRDISERRKARLEIEHLALRDPLTGLANRTSFHRTLGSRLQAGDHVGILILDLDHFKEINDTRGHPVGDEVLRVVASRLMGCVSEGATVARLGGDEFAIVLSNLSEEEAGALADKIGKSLCLPIHLHGAMLRIGASIGVALGQPKIDADVLLRNADIALYEVKNSGRGGHAFFRKAMETLLVERNGMKQDLANALENNEFELYYQPLVDLDTGRICSFEALLRWNHPERGLMPPDTFIPLIEESGLIVPIGAWVMRTACKQALSWPADVAVAVNISTRQFYDPALVATIKSALSDAGLPAHRLELEITESALLNDSGENLVTLASIRGLGHKIALDDFGTGYSSLGYLHKFKFDKLKIDKSFVEGLDAKDEREEIVRTVISLGRTLRMVITAEGVETPEQYAWLKGNCQQAQGHYISHPLPSAHLADFIAKHDNAAASKESEPEDIAMRLKRA